MGDCRAAAGAGSVIAARRALRATTAAAGGSADGTAPGFQRLLGDPVIGEDGVAFRATGVGCEPAVFFALMSARLVMPDDFFTATTR